MHDSIAGLHAVLEYRVVQVMDIYRLRGPVLSGDDGSAIEVGRELVGIEGGRRDNDP